MLDNSQNQCALKKLDETTDPEYYLGIISTKVVIRYWVPETPRQIQYCTIARLFEYQKVLPDGSLSPRYSITHKKSSPKQPPTTKTNTIDHLLCESDPVILTIRLPPRNTIMGLTIKEYRYHNVPYIQTSSYGSFF